MSALRELQTDVLRALYGRTHRAARRVVANGLDPERRLAVYRNNLLVSLGDALEAVYPTVARLVGHEFFRYLAREYVVEHPPRSGNVHEFGAELPAFVASFAPAASLVYLPDVARVDWAWHAVFHRDAEPALDASTALRRIAEQPLDAQPRLRLRVQPAARLVASRYPVFSIWRAHLDDDPPPLSLDDGPQQLLVAQRPGGVIVERLGAAEHALLAALAAGATLGESIAATLDVEPAFDVAPAIAHRFADGTLVGVVDAGRGAA